MDSSVATENIELARLQQPKTAFYKSWGVGSFVILSIILTGSMEKIVTMSTQLLPSKY